LRYLHEVASTTVVATLLRNHQLVLVPTDGAHPAGGCRTSLVHRMRTGVRVLDHPEMVASAMRCLLEVRRNAVPLGLLTGYALMRIPSRDQQRHGDLHRQRWRSTRVCSRRVTSDPSDTTRVAVG